METAPCSQTTLTYDVAAVAITLSEEMGRTDDKNWPEEYSYHMFGGFPGWWRFCGDAGAIFSEVFHNVWIQHPDDPPEYIECVDAFAASLIACLLSAQYPTPDKNIRKLAEATINDQLEKEASQSGPH
jgi:hypothetical protein